MLYLMLYLLLRREGRRANHKRVERLYREEGLALRQAAAAQAAEPFARGARTADGSE
jgi:helix-turn-helix protein